MNLARSVPVRLLLYRPCHCPAGDRKVMNAELLTAVGKGS